MITSELDLKLIAGDFFYTEKEIQNENKFFLHYFDTDLEKIFLIYYFNFQELHEKQSFKQFFENFLDHTGYVCQKRWVTKLIRRFKMIQSKLDEAYKNSDIEKVTEIKTGKLPVSEL